MRLEKLQKYLAEKGWEYEYHEEDGLGSLDFAYRGVGYHVWEFCENEYGAESNVRNGGKQEEYTGDYEEKILQIVNGWE